MYPIPQDSPRPISPLLTCGTLPGVYRFWLPLLVFAAFLTQVKLIPGMRNNVGPFEIVGGLVILGFLLSPRTRRPLVLNPTIQITLAILVLAAVSQINTPAARRVYALTHVGIQLFFVLFLVTLYNLNRQYRLSPETVLRWIVAALFVIGPWIVISGLESDAQIQEAGPFRNRAHMASYMLTGFWIALVYSQWPALRTRHKILAYGSLATTLYAVAISGRRSVYLSLLLGLAVLAGFFLIASKHKRLRLVVAGLFIGGTLYGLYQVGPRYLPQLEFFRDRVAMIDDRLQEVLSVEEEEAVEGSFFALQREGVRRAVSSHPVIGIGWGGFARSHYSPTGHEVHSTPLRFLAETGVSGLMLYIAMMFALVRSVWIGFLRMRRTPFGNAYLVLAVGLSSMLVSYAYNRHVTERTFWLLVIVIFATELFAERYRLAARLQGAIPKKTGRVVEVPDSPATETAGERLRGGLHTSTLEASDNPGLTPS